MKNLAILCLLNNPLNSFLVVAAWSEQTVFSRSMKKRYRRRKKILLLKCINPGKLFLNTILRCFFLFFIYNFCTEVKGDIRTDPKSHARYTTFANSLTKDSEHNKASQMIDCSWSLMVTAFCVIITSMVREDPTLLRSYGKGKLKGWFMITSENTSKLL